MKSLTNGKYYPWVVVALLNYMDRQMLSTMKDSMQVDITDLQSAANFGRLMAVFLWIYGLMSPISGIIADNLSRKKLIVGSLLVWSSVTYFMGLATTYDQVFWLRALMGLSEALYLPAGLSLIADYHTGGSRSLADKPSVGLVLRWLLPILGMRPSNGLASSASSMRLSWLSS